MLTKIKKSQTDIAGLKDGNVIKQYQGTNVTVWANDYIVTIRFQVQDIIPKNNDNTIFVLPSNVKYKGWHFYIPGLVINTSWYPTGTCEINLDNTNGIDMRFPSSMSTTAKCQIMGTCTLPRAFFEIS